VGAISLRTIENTHLGGVRRLNKRKILVVLVDRANYGRLKPVLRAIDEHVALELQIVAAGTMVLQRFHKPVEVVKRDGFQVDTEVYLELEGSTPATMAKSVGYGVGEFAGEYQRLKPDIVLLIGDRYETLAAAIAAAFMNICIAHIQGGEVSGSIDESTRHAISKFAHFHFPSTQRAVEYLIRMGENPDTILTVGCPSSDIARKLDQNAGLANSIINSTGVGATIDLRRSFLLVVFHPTTTQFGGERQQMGQLLNALSELQLQTICLWPNIDAGSDHISKTIRVFRDQAKPSWLRVITNLPPDDYLKILAAASCAIGNSSSFVRDASFFGTPVVLVGSRQDGRELADHVRTSPPSAKLIVQAVQEQLAHGRYNRSTLYGNGHVSERIAQSLAELTPYVQKRLHYIYEQANVQYQRHL
jgi:UDP-hydrolysing UDP-N-acetyl-D-glucosamine 2-epimerase